jgi:prepilin-type N-terminal cleavage/methylation domain-containing protein
MFKKLNKKGFTLAELLIVVAIIGVLVAISIPIFTSQLKKARLATNQANARAAYAAATTEYMLNYADTAPAAAISYTYDTSTGKAELDTTAVAGDLATVDISTWTIDTATSSKKLGDDTAKKWTVALDTDGKVTGYKATF